jgi:glycosyltransferase involved in cell wall biosynthesis
MRVLVDYRPALRERTGVGEYIHQLVRAYTTVYPGEITLFSSSWKDRPAADVCADLGVEVVDRRVPVRLLNLLWHRAEWPPVESLAGPCEVVHAAHPLLIPARYAAQVITIHDLFFLENGGARAEIRRDYPLLAGPHAQRAHAVVTSTNHGRRLIAETLQVSSDRIYVCPPGAPQWKTLGRGPNVPSSGYLLFVGTLEPRKNIGVLLDAYASLLARRADAPALVLAGRDTPEAAGWLSRIAAAPLSGRVRHLGYVPEEAREDLYAGARALVLPSLDEGFGLPVLEAMSAGVAVVASNRGALPEVAGAAAILVDPEDVAALSSALERLLNEETAAWHATAGLERARAFTWGASAATLHRAYADALARRRAAG